MLSKKLLIVLLIALIATQILFAAPLDEKSPPAPTGAILGTDMSAINGDFVSVYLLKTSEGYILFDTGADIKQIEAGLAELELKASDVKWVFLSHSDGDHVAGLPLFAHAQVYISEAEMPMLTGKVKRNSDKYNTLPNGVDVKKFITLKDGQELKIADTTIQSVLMPGHTPGSIAYIIDKLFLFTGDALRLDGDSYAVHPFTMDEAQAQKTIEASADLLQEYVILTAHFGYKVHCGACKADGVCE